MRKAFLKIFAALTLLYLLFCFMLYLAQERFIFFPDKLEKNFSFKFEQKFEEVYIKAEDQNILHGILFRSDSSNGLIFYLHGNAGSLHSWGSTAKTYTDMHYDVFMLDYRGYGKSEGSIDSEEQFFRDIQLAYDEMKKRYDESTIIVLGYSIGTGPAAYNASTNNPKLLILQAPYYSLTDMMSQRYPIVPTFILKYPFETNNYIQHCTMPVVIFHGTDDDVIDYNSSVRLNALIKKSDTLITLRGQGHNGMTNNPEYRIAIERILR